jgi:hypothetical protein
MGGDGGRHTSHLLISADMMIGFREATKPYFDQADFV